MDAYLFRQLNFVRGQVLKQLQGVTEETADRIPDGFRNSIRWNAGHIYVVLERYAFLYTGLPLHLPEGFKEQFEFNTSPLTRPDGVRVPTLPELEQLMSGQLGRIQEALGDRLSERLANPYTTSTGMTLETPEQFLSFNLYHEGMHMSVIKLYKKLLGA